jgi:cytochrome c oxidase subunit 2
MGVFGWGARVYFDQYNVPDQAVDVYVVGKQWMWKFQHPTGQAEINVLHVPVDRPIRLTMISQDVIHSFYVPAFRIKRDVLPHRYTTVWFEATEAGEYHLFCAEFCGTLHSGMIGAVVAMEPHLYQEWLNQQPVGAQSDVIPEDTVPAGPEPGSMASAGAELFENLGCISCHLMEGGGTGPSLVGVFGRQVQLESGETILADENYIRTSILDPNAQIVAGYPPVMPTYEDQIDEEELLRLVEYIKFLSDPGSPAVTEPDLLPSEEQGDIDPDLNLDDEGVDEGGRELDVDDPGDLDEPVGDDDLGTDDPTSSE